MDPVTQGLLGAAASQAGFSKKLGRKAWQIGALAGMAADLDIVIRSKTDPLLFIIYHRQFTHSLSFIPIGGLFVAAVYLLFCKSLRPQWPTVVFAAIVAYATHPLLDACTSYGTVLFWPFSNKRIAWDIISIVDPIFTFILLLGVVTAAIKIQAKPAIIALIGALLYLGFGMLQHYRASHLQQELIQARQQKVYHARVTPTLANLFVWRSLYINKDTIYLDTIYTPIWRQGYIEQDQTLPHYRHDKLPAVIKTNKILMNDFMVFNWFTDGFVSHFSQQPLILIDARYLLARKPLIALWGIQFPQTNDKTQHVRWLRRINQVK